MNHIPAGRHIVEFLANRPEFVGVGKATAKKLWTRFGIDLAAVLGDGDVDRLAEILDRNQAAIVVDAWRNQQALADCVVFFDEHGVDRTLARKALDFWGDEAVSKLLDNPYRMLTICSWKQVDQVARQLQMSASDPRRMIAAVEAVLYDELDRKNTWCSKASLVDKTSKRLACSPEIATRAIDLAVADGAVIETDDGYQAVGAALMERFIEDRIARHLDRSAGDLFLDGIGPHHVAEFLKGLDLPHPLTAEQASAVTMVMANSFSLLVGGAGVGKTTALRAVNAAAQYFGFDVQQVAIAGRAASRIAEATGQPAQTIASWIRGAADGKIKLGCHTLLVVDEASMLDLPTLYRILFHLPQDARLLLVGDIAQLPPIGFGLTLHRLVEEASIPKVELTKILRSDEATGIPQVSMAIRRGLESRLPVFGRQALGCSFQDVQPPFAVDLIEDIVHDLAGEEIQIIAATYRGDAGIDIINQHFHDINARKMGDQRYGFAVGDPCIWTKNDYERLLWNGSMGKITGHSAAGLEATIDGKTHHIKHMDLDKIELAYCISVHKAQGSQFKNVIMPIYGSFFLDRAMIYTGVTRAQDRIILAGDWGAYAEAVKAPPKSVMRQVALRLGR